MSDNELPTGECSGCHRPTVVLCVDCVEALRHPRCVCCEKPVESHYDPYPICPTCEKDVAAELARYRDREVAR
jgi:hypothetical protein